MLILRLILQRLGVREAVLGLCGVENVGNLAVTIGFCQSMAIYWEKKSTFVLNRGIIVGTTLSQSTGFRDADVELRV